MQTDTVWHLSLFGQVGLTNNSESFADFETRRAAKILVLLALSRNGKMRRDLLADLLWPDDFIDSTRLRLRQELSRLRRGIGSAWELIHATQDEIEIKSDSLVTDIDILLNPDRLETSRLTEWLAHEFLDGWTDSWAVSKRDEVEQMLLQAVFVHAKRLIRDQNHSEAQMLVGRALKNWPQNQDLLKLARAAQMDLDVVSDTYVEMSPYEISAAKPMSIGQDSTPRGSSFSQEVVLLPGLPHPIDRYVGRKEELTRIQYLVSDDPGRLVSVVGPGGIGKTRLAVEALKGVNADTGFISFVECGSGQSPESFLLQSILEFKEIIEPIEALKKIFENRAIVLLLDNLEHLDDAPKFVLTLLQSLPDCRIVLTSRRPMKLAGEQVVTLGPLETDGDAMDLLQGLISTRKSSEKDVESYREILRLCGGMPLPIRLAAARLRLLEPQELIEEIRASHGFLEANLPDLENRHKSYDRVLRASFESLTQEEIDALVLFSTFPGGVTRAIAKKLVREDVDGMLDRLLDASLIWLDDETSPLRFRILEPIRQFVSQTIAPEVFLRAQHTFIDTMLDIANQLTLGCDLPPESDYELHRMEANNLHAAIDLAIELNPAAANAIFLRTYDSDYGASRSHEYIALSERLLKHPESSASDRGVILLFYGWIESNKGNYEKAGELSLESQRLFELDGNEKWSCCAQVCNFETYRFTLPWEEAKKGYQRLLELSNRVNPGFSVTIRIYYGLVLSYRSEWEEAWEVLTFAFDRVIEAKNLAGISMAGMAILGAAYGLGRLDEYRPKIGLIEECAQKLNDSGFSYRILILQAHLAYAEGDDQYAEEKARQGINILSFTKNPLTELDACLALCRPLVRQGKFDEAQMRMRQVVPFVEPSWKRFKVTTLACLADLIWAKYLDPTAKRLLGLAKAYHEANSLRLFLPEFEHYQRCLDSIGFDEYSGDLSDAHIDREIIQSINQFCGKP